MGRLGKGITIERVFLRGKLLEKLEIHIIHGRNFMVGARRELKFAVA